MCILLFCVVKYSLGLRELTMSYSYVKCFEGSVVWNVSNLPHEGILTSESNIICVQLFANSERRVCESSFPASAYGCTDPAGRRREHWRASMVRCRALQTLNLPRSRSAEVITSCWESKRYCKAADWVSVLWDYLEFRSIKQSKLWE